MQNHTYEAGVTYPLSYDLEIGDFVKQDKAWNALIYPDLAPGIYACLRRLRPPLRVRFVTNDTAKIQLFI